MDWNVVATVRKNFPQAVGSAPPVRARAILAVETMGDQAGMSLWLRMDLQRYPFLRQSFGAQSVLVLCHGGGSRRRAGSSPASARASCSVGGASRVRSRGSSLVS